MRVYVKVPGAERFPIHTVRNRRELMRVLDFARIGSKYGRTRIVYRVPRGGRGRPQMIAKYVDGKSLSTPLMRARRSPLWGLATVAMLAGLRRVIFG